MGGDDVIELTPSRIWFKAHPVVDRFAEALFASEVSLCRLNRNMPEQEFNLFQLAACCMSQTSARPAEVVRRNLNTSQFGCVRFDDMPDGLFGDAVSPGFPCPTDAPKYLPCRHTAKRAPLVDPQLHPVRHGNSALCKNI
jgi:hypothetical protein